MLIQNKLKFKHGCLQNFITCTETDFIKQFEKLNPTGATHSTTLEGCRYPSHNG
jgi:hypothetical protein